MNSFPSSSYNTNTISGNLTEFTEEQCSNCPKTLFFQNSECICRPGFFLHQGKCIAELGMPDITRTNLNVSDCPIRPGSYSNGACYCSNYWFQDSTNRECIKSRSSHQISVLLWFTEISSYSSIHRQLHDERMVQSDGQLRILRLSDRKVCLQQPGCSQRNLVLLHSEGGCWFLRTVSLRLRMRALWKMRGWALRMHRRLLQAFGRSLVLAQ